MEIIVMKEEVYFHRFQETGETPCHRGSHREGPGSGGGKEGGRT